MECVTIKQEAEEAVECNVVVKCESVKEEPGLEQHEWSSACARVEEEAGGQTECGVSAAAARAGLYAGHEVKGELVLGPTALQPPDAPSAPPPPVIWLAARWAGLSAGSVKLERLPPDAHANSAILSTSAKRQTNLAAGARARAGDKRHQCPVCTKRFSCRSHLVEHEWIHSGEKPYKCDNCRKQFTRRSDLVKHLRVHTGDNPYKCDICQKEFIRKSNLVNHLKVHSGEKLYKCDICHKQFTQKINLVTHVRIHTGEKPYKCDTCQKQFSVKQSLIRHVRTHSGENSLKCDICQQQFRQKRYLVIHMLKPYLHKNYL